MSSTTREVVKDGLWSATQVLAIEAEAEWPDFQAARKAQDELAFLRPLLERLDSLAIPAGVS